MKKSGVKKKNHRGKSSKKKIRDWSGLALLCCLLVSVVGVTLAFFISSDYASSLISMSGPVRIVAVDKNGDPIDDYEDESGEKVSRLVIDLSDNFEKLIPGMPLKLTANCKVFQSATSPLVRAKFEVKLYKNSQTQPGEVEEVVSSDGLSLIADLQSGLNVVITGEDKWVKYSDNYYYYKGNNIIQKDVGDTFLTSVNAKLDDYVLKFIDGKVTVPTYVDETMSGYYVNLSITFEAIQDFVPDEKGFAIDNTITNSKLIFDDTWSNVYESTNTD